MKPILLYELAAMMAGSGSAGPIVFNPTLPKERAGARRFPGSGLKREHYSQERRMQCWNSTQLQRETLAAIAPLPQTGNGQTDLGEALLTLTKPFPLQLQIQLLDFPGPLLTAELPLDVQLTIEASSDLNTWSPIWKDQVSIEPVQFTHGTDGYNSRFYRLKFGAD
jgi:hypothetical protein